MFSRPLTVDEATSTVSYWLAHRATVVTFDRDFGRFDSVNWELPAS